MGLAFLVGNLELKLEPALYATAKFRKLLEVGVFFVCLKNYILSKKIAKNFSLSKD
jgi:hypothetical protein